jgi:glycosyltransferase involved in cell wall biosynthesis
MSIKKNTKVTLQAVSVVIPMRNAATTVLICLKSIISQEYPIKEIIVVDNASTDNSVAIVKKFAKKSKIPIEIIARKENKGVASSYNMAIKKTKTPLTVLMHSDSSLPSRHEIEKLTSPIREDSNVVATYPATLLPRKVWDTYNFWQKRLQIRAVEKYSPGMNTKFDCIRKEVFLKLGGFDDMHFGEQKGTGAQDADLYLRLKKKGDVVLSQAHVIHLHYLGKNYTIQNFITNRKLFARTYGSLMRLHGSKLPLRTRGIGLAIPLGFLIFCVKPVLAILPFIPVLYPIGILLLIIYTFAVAWKMYITPSTLFKPHILLLPFIDIFLVYYESFWMVEAYLFANKEL